MRLLVVVVVAKGGKITPEGAMKAAPALRRATPAEEERSKSVVVIVVTHHQDDRDSILESVTVWRMWVGRAREYPHTFPSSLLRVHRVSGGDLFLLSLPLDRLSAYVTFP